MGLRDWFTPRNPEAAPNPAAAGAMLPAEVVAIIAAARVKDAGRDDTQGNPRIFVTAPGLGQFRWVDLDDAADRFAGEFPELTPVQCYRAAQHIEAAVGDAGVCAMQRRQTRRNWVWDW